LLHVKQSNHIYNNWDEPEEPLTPEDYGYVHEDDLPNLIELEDFCRN